LGGRSLWKRVRFGRFVSTIGDDRLVVDHNVGRGVAAQDRAEVFAGGWMIVVTHAEDGGDAEDRLPSSVSLAHNSS